MKKPAKKLVHFTRNSAAAKWSPPSRTFAMGKRTVTFLNKTTTATVDVAFEDVRLHAVPAAFSVKPGKSQDITIDPDGPGTYKGKSNAHLCPLCRQPLKKGMHITEAEVGALAAKLNYAPMISMGADVAVFDDSDPVIIIA